MSTSVYLTWESRLMLSIEGDIHLLRAQRHVRLSGRAFARSRFPASMSNLVLFPRNFLISSSHSLSSVFPWASSNRINPSTLHSVQKQVKWISSKWWMIRKKSQKLYILRHWEFQMSISYAKWRYKFMITFTISERNTRHFPEKMTAKPQFSILVMVIECV